MVSTRRSAYGGGLIHPDEDRHLTTAELKRVASFPDEFEVLGSLRQQWAQVGNSVPPGMMRAVARAHACGLPTK